MLQFMYVCFHVGDESTALKSYFVKKKYIAGKLDICHSEVSIRAKQYGHVVSDCVNFK